MKTLTSKINVSFGYNASYFRLNSQIYLTFRRKNDILKYIYIFIIKNIYLLLKIFSMANLMATIIKYYFIIVAIKFDTENIFFKLLNK